MAQAKGSDFQFMVIEEATYGTTPGTPSGYIIPVSSIGGDWFTRRLIDNPELRGNRNAAAPVRGNVSVNGSAQFPLHMDATGWILKHAVGEPDTSGTGPYTHVMKCNYSGTTENEDIPVGLTIEHGHVGIGQYHSFTGCRINTLTINATSEGVAILDVGFMGQDYDQDTSSLDAAPTSYSLTAVDHFAVSNIEEGGGAKTNITDLSFTLSNNLDGSQYCVGSSGQIGALPSGLATVTGTFTALFEDDTYLTKGENHTESSLQIAWTQGTASLTIDLPEIVYEPASPAVTGPAGVLVRMNFRSYYANHADKTVLKATLVNSVSAY